MIGKKTWGGVWGQIKADDRISRPVHQDSRGTQSGWGHVLICGQQISSVAQADRGRTLIMTGVGAGGGKGNLGGGGRETLKGNQGFLSVRKHTQTKWRNGMPRGDAVLSLLDQG